MIEKSLAKKLLGILYGKDSSFAEIYIQEKITNNLKIEDGKIENASSGFELGCGFRIIAGESTLYAFVDSIEEDRLIETAQVLRSSITVNGNQKIIDLCTSRAPFEIKIFNSPDSVSNEEKTGILYRVDKKARQYSDSIIQVTSNISDSREKILVANTDGIFSEDSLTKVILTASVVAKKDNIIKTGYKSYAKTRGYEIFNNKKPEDIASGAARMAVKNLDAIDAPAGTFPVVIGPAFGGVIFHEACGHGLEADEVLKGGSVFKGMIGKKVASDIVTAIDDSTMPGHWGSYRFDGEGHSGMRNILIKDGILENYMSDRKTALMLKTPCSGNARRDSFRSIPYPRMSNTFIDKGQSDPDSIVKNINKGIFAKEFSGGQVDPATGNFVFGISEGYLIENGKLSFPISGATLIGNGLDVLKRIEAVGNDLDFAPGFCGKNGQSITNEVGQPTIYVNSLTVGGTKI